MKLLAILLIAIVVSMGVTAAFAVETAKIDTTFTHPHCSGSLPATFLVTLDSTNNQVNYFMNIPTILNDVCAWYYPDYVINVYSPTITITDGTTTCTELMDTITKTTGYRTFGTGTMDCNANFDSFDLSFSVRYVATNLFYADKTYTVSDSFGGR